MGSRESIFEVVIIGGGSAGIAAIDGAKAAGAKSICLIEAESRLGGECAYWACVPTKAMLKAAQIYYQAKHAAGRYGISVGQVKYNFSALLKRRDAVVKSLTGDGQRLLDYAKQQKVTVEHGSARFTHSHTVLVAGKRIKGEAFVIATGSLERQPVLDGAKTVPMWYSRDVVTMRQLPSSVAIIGAGPVGSEFATLFGLLGAKTILLEAGQQILPREDTDIARAAHESLEHLGVRVLTKTKPLGLKRDGRKFRLTFQVGRQPRQTVLVDRVIAAVGRQPNLDNLALATAGVEFDTYRRLVLAQTLQTSQGHIFAAGDVTSHLQFTHIASHEGYIAGWNAALAKTKEQHLKREEIVVPRITFVAPEVASVGLTEIEARLAKKQFKVLRLPFVALGRAAIDGQREGLIKILVEHKTGLILGGHLIGERAGEVMHELALAMYAGIPFATVQNMLHAYPSWSEVIPAAR